MVDKSLNDSFMKKRVKDKCHNREEILSQLVFHATFNKFREKSYRFEMMW